MIIEYHRPEKLEEALRLLARRDITTVPLAGGTVVNQPEQAKRAVVDLQALGLDHMLARGQTITIGAMVTLQQLLAVADLPPAFHKAIRHEATYNLRQVATLVGTLVAGNGRSPLVCAALALDAQVKILPEAEIVALGDLLPLRAEKLTGRLIVEINLPLNARLAYEYVARTPADQPVVCVAAAQWPSGRARVVVGGFGNLPRLALDGPADHNFEAAVRNVCANAEDEWASAVYRQEAALVLARRALEAMAGV